MAPTKANVPHFGIVNHLMQEYRLSNDITAQNRVDKEKDVTKM